MLNFAKEITKFHYKNLKSPYEMLFGAAVYIPLFVLSAFYFFAIAFKNLMYKAGILHETKVLPKVICIGNLTAGGVGKTPVTIEFCNFLAKKYKVSSLSRGYKGKLKGANIVRDFEKILIENPDLTGDEVNLIAKESKGYAVTVSSDRVKGANKAAEELGAEIIIMDDGFSNRKIKKDLSLLLFDVKRPIGNGGMLPFGPLREPVSEIHRADAVVLIDKENSSDLTFKKTEELLIEKLKFKGKIFRAKAKPDYFCNVKTKEITDRAKISHAFAFAGIGRPDLFYKYLSNEPGGLEGFNPSCTLSFDDHHEYTKEDIKNIEALAKKRCAKCLVTTEKDAVKISKLIENTSLPVFSMKLKTEIDIESILSELNFGEKNEA